MDFAVPENHRVKLKEIEKRDKYLDLVREKKSMYNELVCLEQSPKNRL